MQTQQTLLNIPTKIYGIIAVLFMFLCCAISSAQAIATSTASSSLSASTTITTSATISKPIENTTLIKAIIEASISTSNTASQADKPLTFFGKIISFILNIPTFLENTIKFITTLSLFLVMVLYLPYLAYKEVTKNTIIMEPFEMPEELIKEGYTGKSIAHQLKDKFEYIYESGKDIKALKEKIGEHDYSESFYTMPKKGSIARKIKKENYQPEMKLSWEQEEIQLSLGNFSIKSLKALLYPIKEFFGYKVITISGEIQKIDNVKYKIIARYDGKICTSQSIDKKEIQDNLLYSAEELYEKIHPETLAFYFFNHKNEEKTEKIINMILQRLSRETPYTILILAAWLKFNQKKYYEAIQYLEKLGL